MAYSNSVRETVAAPTQSVFGGAVQGAGNYLKMQQAKEEQSRKELLSLVPIMAQMKMLAPAQEGDEGAIDVGGQWVKFTPRAADSSDLLSDARRRVLEMSMTPEAMKTEALKDFLTKNPHILQMPAAKQKVILDNAEAQYDKMYPSTATGSPGSPAAVGEEFQVLSPKEYEDLDPKIKAKKKAIKTSRGYVLTDKGDAPINWGALGGTAAILGAGAAKLGHGALANAGMKLGVLNKGVTPAAAGLARMLPGLAKAGPGLAASAGAAAGTATGRGLYDMSSESGARGGWNPIGAGGLLEQAIAKMMLQSRSVNPFAAQTGVGDINKGDSGINKEALRILGQDYKNNVYQPSENQDYNYFGGVK